MVSKRLRNVLFLVLLAGLLGGKAVLDVSLFRVSFVVICCFYLGVSVVYLISNRKLDVKELGVTFGFMGLLLVLLIVGLLVL